MKRQIIISLTYFLLAITFSFPAYGQITKTGNQKGKVKFASVFEYDHMQRWGGGPLIDSLMSKATFTYDEAGKLLKSNYYNVKTNTVFSNDERVYDGKGNMLEITYSTSVGTGKNVYKYDEQNHEIEKTTYIKGAYYEKVVTSRDYKSMMVKFSIYNSDSSLQSSTSSKVDEKGNTLESYDEEGKLSSRSSYQYNAKGKIEMEQWESWEDGYTKGSTKIVYDKWANEVQRINIGEDGEITSNKIEFTYDQFGNWTKQVKTWSNYGIKQILKREIVYY